ncbi:MAG: outer membrane protein assembly factor BamD [Alphaproteobacteria bacterium]|nr:outer membrane protein assembly factor BamD [Alphaproteobacteria bacterium]
MKRLLVVLMAGMLVACASAKESAEIEMTPEAQYLKGYHAFQEKDFDVAIEAFDAVEQNFPYSEWAERAQIMMAYAQYKQNKYPDALLTLDRFIQLHPGNKNTPYALYLKGLCYFEQMSDVTREQEMTANAEQSFHELIARYPASIYRNDAEAKLVSIQNHLAGKEMEIGRYYQKRADFTAAMNRFQQVLKNYPDSNQMPEAYYRLTACYKALGMNEQAEKIANTLARKYENSEWSQKALRLVKD